ncbi:MAG: FAD-dependent oxidoreductase [Polyangiaceae bacterium]|nr:FAD-dependent oxidoreductase [Polyangiaceae bacterium]
MTSALPAQARAVIIGGGVIGTSTAYHLAKLGYGDVVLLERARLTSGSTFHAAGLVGQLRTSASITQLLKYSVELYENLEAETGLATGFKRNGGLRLACNPERWTEVKRQATTAHSFGLEMHLLSPKEARDLWPIMEIDDLVGAAFLPTDGQVDPSDLTQSLAKGARQRGVKIVEECPVTEIVVKNGRVTGVRTPLGDIACEVVVNCGGIWARKVAELANVRVPIQAMQHQYIITEPFDGVPKNLPTLRDPDLLCYYKEEVGGLTMGGYEPNPIPWGQSGIPQDFFFQLLEPDWDHFEQLMAPAIRRVPALAKVGVRKLINGPESFTPDGSFILGEAPEVRGFFVGAGFNAYGMAAGGGAGRALAEWIVEGSPTTDLWPVDIRRFGRHHDDHRWVLDRTREAYAKHYTMAWPFEEDESCRPVKVSPLYLRLKEQRACFGSKMGWERPNWFAPPGVEPQDEYTYGRQNWFEHVRREHEATRTRVAVFDQTSFAKFSMIGRDAGRVLTWLCANDVDKPVGKLVYTQMCNRRGGIECDVTVSRVAEDAYYILTGTAYGTHDADWIRKNSPPDADARLVDVTGMYTVLSVMGPSSRAVLSTLTDSDFGNEVFPFGTFQEVAIGGAAVRALRMTFVGELGWELHVPVESALMVYDRVMAAGAPFGIVNAGYRAIDSLRLEKGYKNWGSDLTPNDTPLEAGHGWAVKLKSDVPFLGREALVEQRKQPLRKQFAMFSVEGDRIVLLGRETVLRNGERVGYLTSAGYGYTVERGIGYGYVRMPAEASADFMTTGNYELEVAGARVPCELHTKPLYDPKMERVKS